MFKIILIHPLFEVAHRPVFSFIVDGEDVINTKSTDNFVIIPADDTREFFKEKLWIPITNIKVIIKL